MFDELRELLLVSFFIVVHQLTHVVSDVQAHDVLAVDLSIEFLGFGIVTRETFGAVGYIDTSVNDTLHGAEDSGTSRGTGQTNVQEGAEGTRSFLDILNIENSTGDFGAALIDGIKLKLLQQLWVQKQKVIIVN